MPRRTATVETWKVFILAILALLAWWFVARSGTSVLHPDHPAMLRAARVMQRGAEVIHAEKAQRDLLVGQRYDPNDTGLIGPEWSPIVTTYGDLSAKRTLTNPDLAAAVVSELHNVSPERGETLVTVVSGSFVGANLAVLAAAEAMDLRVVAMTSLGASMWGATDPEFTWLDMEAALREARVIGAKSLLAVLGGDSAMGGGIGEPGLAALRESATRHDVPVWEREDLEALTEQVFDEALSDSGGPEHIGAFVNVGGSMLSMGLCREAASYPVGLSRRRLPCSNGAPGLMSRMSDVDVPVVHVLNIDEFALRHGLPWDPRPLPMVGNNARLYGGR